MLTNCLFCKKEFKTKPSLIKMGKGKYCKKACYNKSLIGKPSKSSTKFKKGQTSWNKGVPPSEETRKKWSIIRKGQHNSLATEFKKGERVGELHPMWREKDYGYSAIHMWIKGKLGKAVNCVECGSINDKRTQYGWANISRLYLRDLNDWKPLCAKCHSAFDKNQKQMTYDYNTRKRLISC